jgi:hypothetical protein
MPRVFRVGHPCWTKEYSRPLLVGGLDLMCLDTTLLIWLKVGQTGKNATEVGSSVGDLTFSGGLTAQRICLLL